MKMKELSALTGIPDRTIRYYISDGIFVPEKYTENYQGRRNYDFTDNDVMVLKQIATLRKYEFSMKDIKSMFKGTQNLEELLSSHMNHMKKKANYDLDLVNSLNNAIGKNPSNINSLCELLNTPLVVQAPIPIIDNRTPYQMMYRKTSKNNKILAVVLVIVILLFAILNVPIYKTNSEGIINEDYSGLIYHAKTYLVFDYQDFEALHSTTIAKNIAVENESFLGHLISMENLEAMDDAPISEMLYLQTDYDYQFPEGNSDRYYIEKSVYDNYMSIIDNFTPNCFYLYYDKYDSKSYRPIDSDLYEAITNSDNHSSVNISDYFVKGQTGGSYFICAYQKPFYLDIGEIRQIDESFYFLSYQNSTISNYADGESKQVFYKIDDEYNSVLKSLLNTNETATEMIV